MYSVLIPTIIMQHIQATITVSPKENSTKLICVIYIVWFRLTAKID